jgi:hypothetical protein
VHDNGISEVLSKLIASDPDVADRDQLVAIVRNAAKLKFPGLEGVRRDRRGPLCPADEAARRRRAGFQHDGRPARSDPPRPPARPHRPRARHDRAEPGQRRAPACRAPGRGVHERPGRRPTRPAGNPRGDLPHRSRDVRPRPPRVHRRRDGGRGAGPGVDDRAGVLRGDPHGRHRPRRWHGRAAVHATAHGQPSAAPSTVCHVQHLRPPSLHGPVLSATSTITRSTKAGGISSSSRTARSRGSAPIAPRGGPATRPTDEHDPPAGPLAPSRAAGDPIHRRVIRPTDRPGRATIRPPS